MNSSEIFQAIETIAATSSKNEKQALVKHYANDDIFRSVLVAAYNPFRTYGLAAFPYRTQFGTGHFNYTTWAVLDQMVNRKLTGNAAREAVQNEINRLDGGSSELLRRIIKKDLRAGFSESTINKAVKNLIPEFSYMRCSLPTNVDLTKFDWKAGVIQQEKADGAFGNLSLESGGIVSLTSRQGSPFPIEKFGKLAEEVKWNFPVNCQYHGEILVIRDGAVLSRKSSNGVLNSLLNGGDFEANEYPIYKAWDFIPLSCAITKGRYERPYRERLAVLVEILRRQPLSSISLIPSKIVHSLEEAYENNDELMRRGKEGSILKDPRAIWRDGKSTQQVKLKGQADVDLEIVKLLPGEGRNAETFGSILVKTSDGLLEVAVAGFSFEIAAYIWKHRDEMPGKIMTVRANEIMYPSKSNSKHSLYLPRHIEIRFDKSKADTLQQVIDQFDLLVKKKAA